MIPMLLAAAGCSTTPRPDSSSNAVSATTPAPATSPKAKRASADLTKISGFSASELDREFGPPIESKRIEKNGEYRLYRVYGQSRGLAVRLFGGRATQFNLIVDEPFKTSKEALKGVFNIDVGDAKATIDPKEPLTESFRGTFGGVKFVKLSAKRAAPGEGFILALADIQK